MWTLLHTRIGGEEQVQYKGDPETKATYGGEVG